MTDTAHSATELQTAAMALVDAELAPANGNGNHSGDEKELTGWEPVDVAQVIAAGCRIEEPTLGARVDGVCLFYAGKLHALNGEPESGKSWLAQYATVQALAGGLHVCYLDFEDSAAGVIGRLLDLGADPVDVISRFTYINPAGPFTADAVAVIRERFRTHRPAMSVIDGMNEAMTTLELDPDSTKDSAKFYRLLPRRLARTGAAVVAVDHVVKDKEQRGRWAIGSQHKMAALSGAAYSVEAVQPFGRNKAGLARITITKDRPGWIRQYGAGATIAEFSLNSADGRVAAELRVPAQAGESGFRPTVKMLRISQVLGNGPALSKNALYEAAGKGRRETFQLALELLISEGYVWAQRTGQTVYHSLTRPFSDEKEGGAESDEPF
jgi:hypothetical protein